MWEIYILSYIIQGPHKQLGYSFQLVKIIKRFLSSSHIPCKYDHDNIYNIKKGYD